VQTTFRACWTSRPIALMRMTAPVQIPTPAPKVAILREQEHSAGTRNVS
jgi:hypothetical protein